MSINIFNIDDFRADTSAISDDKHESNALPSQLDIKVSERLMPSNLSDDEKNIWRRLGPYLVKHGRLNELYVDVFHEYCVTRVRLESARRFLDKTDWTYAVSGRNGEQIKSKPHVAQLNDDWRKWRSLAGELGLGPRSSKALNALGEGKQDLFDDL